MLVLPLNMLLYASLDLWDHEETHFSQYPVPEVAVTVACDCVVLGYLIILVLCSVPYLCAVL